MIGVAERPYALLIGKPTALFGPTRAPASKHIAWGYCHVPHGSSFDMSARIEAQIETSVWIQRSASIARHVMSRPILERHNSNLIGGDITGGANLLQPTFYPAGCAARSVSNARSRPLYLFGLDAAGRRVHGMCGYWAAQSACDGSCDDGVANKYTTS